jgi:hypothetical protein
MKRIIFSVESNPEIIEAGEIVLFITGQKSINTYPQYLRIGQVISVEKLEVIELSTSKIWKVYTSSLIKVNSGIRIKNVKAVLVETDDKI